MAEGVGLSMLRCYALINAPWGKTDDVLALDAIVAADTVTQIVRAR